MKISIARAILKLVDAPVNCYNRGYFEAARSWQIRSILDVCEEFGNKADAKRALQ